jgi:hypothetical protein
MGNTTVSHMAQRYTGVGKWCPLAPKPPAEAGSQPWAVPRNVHAAHTYSPGPNTSAGVIRVLGVPRRSASSSSPWA